MQILSILTPSDTTSETKNRRVLYCAATLSSVCFRGAYAMRPITGALGIFLTALAGAQAHVPEECGEEVSTATIAIEELATKRSDKNTWLMDWMEAHGHSIRPFTMDEFAEFFRLELLVANAQIPFDTAIEELISCIEGS